MEKEKMRRRIILEGMFNPRFFRREPAAAGYILIRVGYMFSGSKKIFFIIYLIYRMNPALVNFLNSFQIFNVEVKNGHIN